MKVAFYTYFIVNAYFVTFATEESHLDIVNSVIFRSLKIQDVNKVSKNDGFPRFLDYVYSSTEDFKSWTNPNDFGKTNDVFSAIKSIIRGKSKTNVKLSFNVQIDNQTKNEEGLIILQLKPSMRNHSYTTFKCVVSDDYSFFTSTISSVNIISSEDTTWIEIDVASLLKQWQVTTKDPMKLNLFIEFFMISEIKTNQIVTSGYNRPLLLLIYDTEQFSEIMKHVKTKKRESRPRRSAPEVQSTTTGCTLHDWEVNFEESIWYSYVKRPKKLQVNYCAGPCIEPLDDNANASVHARVRSLMRVNHPHIFGDLPPITCAANGYKKVTLFLYSSIEERYIYQDNYQLIAESCACL